MQPRRNVFPFVHSHFRFANRMSIFHMYQHLCKLIWASKFILHWRACPYIDTTATNCQKRCFLQVCICREKGVMMGLDWVRFIVYIKFLMVSRKGDVSRARLCASILEGIAEMLLIITLCVWEEDSSINVDCFLKYTTGKVSMFISICWCFEPRLLYILCHLNSSYYIVSKCLRLEWFLFS